MELFLGDKAIKKKKKLSLADLEQNDPGVS